jgi:UV DNA damage repair endonuclease
LSALQRLAFGRFHGFVTELTFSNGSHRKMQVAAISCRLKQRQHLAAVTCVGSGNFRAIKASAHLAVAVAVRLFAISLEWLLAPLARPEREIFAVH